MNRAIVQRLGVAALLGLSILTALALGEVAVRLLLPQYLQGADPIRNPFWHHDARLGWRHEPGARGLFQRDEFSHPVAINGAGWRDLERSMEKPAGRFRVAVLGDSFTWGHGVADEEVFTRRIEQDLPATEVLNFGLSGSATDQQLLILREAVLPYRPDLVLVMITRNDFGALLEEREGSYFKPRFELDGAGALHLAGVPVPAVSQAARWHYGLRRRLALLNLVESRLEASGKEGAAAAAGSPGVPPRSARAYALMKAILKTMADESAAAGARFAITLVPSNAHTYPDPIPVVEVRRHEVLRDIAAEAGFPLLDLVPAFREAAVDRATGGRVELHYRRDLHWNERGHALAARELTRLMREARLLPVPPADGPL